MSSRSRQSWINAATMAQKAQPRPLLTRSDTDGLLSYYQSDLADKGPGVPSVQADTSSSDLSDYSSEDDSSSYYSGTQRVRHRASGPSEGADDRRRIVIMSSDTAQHSTRDNDLVMVAPPDALKSSYSSSTFPLPQIEASSSMSLHPTAKQSSTDQPIITPEIGQSKEIGAPVASPVVTVVKSVKKSQHSTSQSFLNYQPGVHASAGPLPPPPRACFEIDSSVPPPPRPPRLGSPSPLVPSRRKDLKEALQLPPSVTAALSRGHSESSGTSSHRREAAFSPSTISSSFTSVMMSSSTNFHDESTSTATPMSVNAIQAEEHIPKDTATEVIAPSTLPSFLPIQEEKDDWTSVPPPISRRHSRSQSPEKSAEVSPPRHSNETQSPIESPRQSLSSSVTSHSHQSHSPFRNSPSPNASHTGHTPSPPPKSFRNSLTTGLRRMSTTLQREPSNSGSDKDKRASPPSHSQPLPTPPFSHPYQHFQHSVPHDHFVLSLPPHRPPHPTPASQRKRSLNPSALYCHEVRSQRSTAERIMIYTEKLQELAQYDCGLSEWVIDVQTVNRTGGKGKEREREHIDGRVDEDADFLPNLPETYQPRSTGSRMSVMTEATFPRRPDASTATDLSVVSSQSGSSSPTLPYPTLLSGGNVLRVPTKTGFFASLGRKASSARRERSHTMGSDREKGTNSTSGSERSVRGLLTKNPPAFKSNHHSSLGRSSSPSKARAAIPVVNQNPSVPGGPRAPGYMKSTNSLDTKKMNPNRMARSQTLMVTPLAHSSARLHSGSDHGHGSESSFSTIRTPSSATSSVPVKANMSGPRPPTKFHDDPEFALQVNKLQDLLPQADREVLAGYLRRAGQDILAIGLYLEDEKCGKIKPASVF